ncbi:hypothetical protein LTS15_001872 [Exophiala xenobiotica]|nr:hypothetical protein LTS15_001872 [Exophiala xenobiotica]
MAAGLDIAAGAIGIAATAFTSAVQVYGFISTALDLQRDAPISFWKLRIEEIRLRSWGRFWGYDNGSMDSYLEQEHLVEDVRGILNQIKALLEDSVKFTDRYGLTVEGALAASTTSSSSSSSSDPNSSTRPGLQKNWPRKFKWALADKKKFEVLVADLKTLNDGLFGLLRFRELSTINQIANSSVLRAANSTNDVSFMKEACLENQNQSADDSTFLASWERPAYNELIRGAGSKYLVLQQSRQIVVPSGIAAPAPVQPTLLREASLMTGFSNLSATRVLAQYQARAVLVEWKEVDASKPNQRLISQRVEDLAQFLSTDSPKPDGFRALGCLGYFHDQGRSRLGYIFELPLHVATKPPCSLFDFLARDGENTLLADLGDRFAIARSISAAMMRLHDCGWVHTAFRSEAVVFFYHGQVWTPLPVLICVVHS